MRRLLRSQVVGLCLLLEVSGCGDGGTPSGSPAAGSAVAPPVSEQHAPALGHLVRGRVTMPDGSPISTPDAKVSLVLIGVPDEPGENLQYNLVVSADGTYEQPVSPGRYHFSHAMIEVPYGGVNYRLDLDPVGDMHAPRPSHDGIVQDFVWRISGPRPGYAGDSEQPMHWYGAHLSFQYAIYREDVKRAFPLPDPGTRFLFELTPQGPLIDGSPGQKLQFEREWTADMSVTSTLSLPDLPIGSYALSGEIVKADGSRHQAVFEAGLPNYSPQVVVEFPPRRLTNSTESRQLAVGELLDE